MPEHSPAPWRAGPIIENSDKTYWRHVWSRDTVLVARVNALNYANSAGMANARLIEQAPNLAYALQKLRALVDVSNIRTSKRVLEKWEEAAEVADNVLREAGLL